MSPRCGRRVAVSDGLPRRTVEDARSGEGFPPPGEPDAIASIHAGVDTTLVEEWATGREPDQDALEAFGAEGGIYPGRGGGRQSRTSRSANDRTSSSGTIRTPPAGSRGAGVFVEGRRAAGR